MVPAPSHRVSRVPWYSGSCFPPPPFAYGALTLSGRPFQDRSAGIRSGLCSPNPGVHRTPVWAPPVPLAATPGITFVFSSSGYLDVSVRRVPLRILSGHFCPYSHADTRSLSVWVPPFRYPWISGYVLLPTAFRSLSRLSSALSARASTLRSFLLNLFFSWFSCLLHSVAARSFAFFVFTELIT